MLSMDIAMVAVIDIGKDQEAISLIYPAVRRMEPVR